jgi:hypothetical protein
MNIQDLTYDERKVARVFARFYLDSEEHNRTLPGHLDEGAWVVANGHGIQSASFVGELRTKSHNAIRALGFQVGDARTNTINRFVLSHMHNNDVLVSLRDLLRQLETT